MDKYERARRFLFWANVKLHPPSNGVHILLPTIRIPLEEPMSDDQPTEPVDTIITPNPDMDASLEDRLCKICDDFCEVFPKAEWGPAHVILSDYNFDVEFINNAIDTIEARLGWKEPTPYAAAILKSMDNYKDHSDEEFTRTREVLIFIRGQIE